MKLKPMNKWNGYIPERRYAMFDAPLRGNYLTVIRGNDMLTAPMWGGFIKWVGGTRPSEIRKINGTGGG